MQPWLVPAYDAWCDLGKDATWRDVRDWSAHYSIDFEWLFPVLRRAAHIVDEHREKQRKQKRASTPRTRTDRA